MPDTATPVVLSCQGVSYWYEHGRTVLQDVSLSVSAGDVVVVRGSNGSGKTTLLRLAAGAARARGGTVSRMAPVGYQPQTGDEPPPRMTSAEWLAALGRMRRARGGTQSLTVLEAFGVPPGARFGSLSRGTITKVLLAAALAGQPRLVLLDEPFAPLDATARDTAAALIKQAAANGAGVLLSDHHGAGDLVATHVATISDRRLTGAAAPAGPPAADQPESLAGCWRIVVRAPGEPARELVVPAAERDATLLAALQRGEEVRRVEELG
ncbi:MAG TPA: ATP-binding cassette domain-containing protein [Streptosporangiaceae bacterium]|jgi:ABC-type multidrug transport system ATPase subunit